MAYRHTMRLDDSLRDYEFLRVERPPLLWEADTDEVPFARLLDGLIALGALRDNQPAQLTLNVSNMTVEESAADARLAMGDYVAITVRGGGTWGPEVVWWPGAAAIGGPIAHLGDVL